MTAYAKDNIGLYYVDKSCVAFFKIANIACTHCQFNLMDVCFCIYVDSKVACFKP